MFRRKYSKIYYFQYILLLFAKNGRSPRSFIIYFKNILLPSVPLKKDLDNCKTITYEINFINSFKFISRSLSSLVYNLSDGFHCDKCIDCKSYLDHIITKDDQLIFTCFECKKNYQKEFKKDLINRFANIYEFCN